MAGYAKQQLVNRTHPDDQMNPAKDRPEIRRQVRVNIAENPVDWLAARGMVSAQQQQAAEKLRQDFERAGLSARVTMRWNAAPLAKSRSGARADDASLARMDSHRRFHAALDAVGPGLVDICWRVICGGEGISGAEKGLGWPARSGKLVLGMALDRLARFYGT
ncbi:MAG TPA: DUF6456 domain-containing protein [Sphingopyxis sp.]|nr:DUF6456 domain-containing protein [Sphingopyxis sp.]